MNLTSKNDYEKVTKTEKIRNECCRYENKKRLLLEKIDKTTFRVL